MHIYSHRDMLLAVLLLLFSATTTRSEECTEITTEETTFSVYYGWPLLYRCINIFDNIDYPEDLEEYGEYTCIISEATTGEVIFESAFSGSLYDLPKEKIDYRFENIMDTSPLKYITRLQNASSCWIENVILEPQVFVEESCEENVERIGTIDIEKRTGTIFMGLCVVPRNADLPMELVDRSIANISWLYNCGTKLPSNTYRNEKEDTLFFRNISFQSNPGIYTCAVEYNNMTRYRIHRKVCVKVPPSRTTTIQCGDQRSALGDDVQIECFIDAGIGIENLLVLFGRINKLNASGEIDDSSSKLTCLATAEGGKQNISNGRGVCELVTLNRDEDDIHCFDRQPTNDELAKQRTNLKLILKIKNVKESDFGKYQATITRASKSKSSSFTITYDKTNTLIRSNVILIIAISVTVGCVLFLIMLCVLCGVEVRWICFKIFRRKETEIKSYSAYLTYYYQQDMSQTDSSRLESFVLKLIAQLEKNGGKVFNDSEELSDKQYKVESIVSKLSDCHRVVILLTPEYINDEWSVLEAAEAWKNVIEQGSKIIFIKFSETDSAIEKLDAKPQNFLKAALKRHKVIEWNGNLPLTRRFRMKLEMYMPKLKQNCSMEMQPTTPSNEEPFIKTKRNGHHLPNTASQIDTNGNIPEEEYANGL